MHAHHDDLDLLNYQQAATLLGLALGTLYSLVHQRRIPHVRLGSRLVRFPKAELVRWLADHVVHERTAGASGRAGEPHGIVNDQGARGAG